VTLPFITDPYFYLVAIPSVILIGLSKSGFGAGFGSLAVPIMALTVSVPQAAAVLMPILLLVDLLGMAAFRRNFDMQLVKFLLPWGLLGTLLGTVLFKVLPANVVAGLVGGFTLLFLAQRLLFPPRPDSPPPPRWLGRVLTTTAGFTSFISHAGAPPVSAYLIPMRLPPVVYASSLAFFFFIINMSKWIPYAWLGLLDLRNMATSILLMPFAPIGVWAGVRLARRISPQLFYRLLTVGMFLTGVKLLWDGFR
jgi:uncharacterized membrane protein YfcA